MTVYGYARISTPHQNIERQVRNIQAIYKDAVIIKEVYTGTKIDRVKFNNLINKLVKPGDKIVFDSVSRMSRDSEDGFMLYQELFNRGIVLEFLKEPHINTETFRQALENKVELTGTNVDIILEAVNKYLMEVARSLIKLAFDQAEKEVTDLKQRTKEGLLTAKLKGHQVGRIKGAAFNIKKEFPAKKKIVDYSKTFNGTLNNIDTIKVVGIAKNTFYKYKKELERQNAIYEEIMENDSVSLSSGAALYDVSRVDFYMESYKDYCKEQSCDFRNIQIKGDF